MENKDEIKMAIYSYYKDYKNVPSSCLEEIEYDLDNNIEKELDYCRIEYDFIRVNNIKDKTRVERLDYIWDELNYLKSEREEKGNE